jgi:glycosyltransferase involved in cell wall biosynthesis
VRIGFDVAQTCAQRAGCAWYADSLARAMVKLAPDNEYFLYHQFGRWINDDTAAGTFVQHPSVKMPFWGKDAESSRQIWEQSGPGTTLPGEPEIVQSNSFQVIPTAGARLVFVVYDISFWIYPEFTTEANRLNCQYGVLEAVKRADGLLFISESGRNEFESLFPGLLERKGKLSAAIPLASRIVSAGENGKPAEAFWLAVGSMEPRKNYNAIFSAIDLYWSRSKRPSPVWIAAAAAGWKNEEMKMRARHLEAKGRIRILGYVDEERLAALYRDSLGLVFPSWYEGFGLPVLEAMQCGCSVICSNRTSLPEVGGDVPLYIDPAEPESICDAMILLEENPERRRQCREAGLRRAKEFNWSRTAQATLEFYRQVLDN